MDPHARLFSSLTTTYQAQDAAIRTRIVDYVRTKWAMGSWRDADIDRFVAAVVPVIEAGQQQAAALTTAYLAQVALRVFTAPRLTTKAPDVSTERLRGVPADEVFRRPATTTYTKLSDGAPLQDAVAAGAARAVSLTVTNLQLARTTAAQARFSADQHITGYRRVLTGSEDCALCVIASTQRYHRGDLMPIHPGCDCSVAPIYGNRDPGQIINQGLLTDTHTAVEALAGRQDASARNIGLDTGRDYTHLIVTHHHGEYGPTLAWRDQHFTGPTAVNQPTETAG